MFNNLKTSSVVKTNQSINPGFVVFANFHGINIPTMANIKLSMWGQPAHKIAKNLPVLQAGTGQYLHTTEEQLWKATVVE